MSNALFCDTCTQVFPEGAEGSVSGTGTFTRVVDGIRKEVPRRQDQCPDCAAAQQSGWNARPAVRPQIAREIDARVREDAQRHLVDDTDEEYARASGRPGYGA